MASRYPITKVVDYCYNPIHVVKDGRDIIVPCGKCDGCLLHKANEWSMRCGMEIEDSPATIFGTLTYDNKYLPKLFPIQFEVNDGFYEYTWISDHPANVRFNSVCDVRRDDGIVIPRSYAPIDIQKWDNLHFPAINYCSKRDIQLWLKLLRRKLDDYAIRKNSRIIQNGYFRYYVVSEVGPTTYRSHAHFLLFCQSSQVSEALLDGILYQSWKMCDEVRFTKYTHLCDAGARGYVTQYLTGSSDLPKVYREESQVRPFRLASKSPAVGYIGQDPKAIFSDIALGLIRYSRPLPRLESNIVLEYPKDFLSTLFPKCYNFNEIPYRRRYVVYGLIYEAVNRRGYSYYLLLSRLSKSLHPSDFLATCACFRFCKKYINSPEHYVFLLDMYYYQLDMSHLKSFYESQSEFDFSRCPEKIFEYYPNIETLCLSDNPPVLALRFLQDFGYNLYDLIGNKDFFTAIKEKIRRNNDVYYREVSDIKDSMVKMSKYNEFSGNAPTIV